MGASKKVADRYMQGQNTRRPELKVANGKAGTKLSWQGGFDETVPCVKCGKKARVVMGLQEVGGDYVTREHPNNPHGDREGEPGFWFHDAMAVCLYLCTDIDCRTMTAEWDQA